MPYMAVLAGFHERSGLSKCESVDCEAFPYMAVLAGFHERSGLPRCESVGCDAEGEIFVVPIYGKVMSSQVVACVEFQLGFHSCHMLEGSQASGSIPTCSC